MASEGKSASDRLSEYFALAPEIGKSVEDLLRRIGRQYDMQLEMHDLDWIDPSNPFLMVHINKAFADARLDPNVPWHWRLLLYLFALAHYSKTKRKTWNSTSYCRLLQAADKIRSKYPHLSEKEICVRLVRTAPYRRFRADHLRKMLRQARDPKKNPVLSLIADSALESLLQFGERHKLPGGEQVEAALKPLFVQEAFMTVASAWRSKKNENESG
jgi:hypothetical protein